MHEDEASSICNQCVFDSVKFRPMCCNKVYHNLSFKEEEKRTLYKYIATDWSLITQTSLSFLLSSTSVYHITRKLTREIERRERERERWRLDL